MSPWKRGWLCGALAVSAGCTGPVPGSICKTTADCKAGARCDTSIKLCVQNLPPVIAIDSPLATDLLAGMARELRGTAIDDEGPVALLELSLDQGATWTPLPVAAGGTFATTLTLPLLDAKPFPIQVRATDASQQVTNAAVTPTVDNVAPKLSLVSPDAGVLLGPASVATAVFAGTVSDGSGQARVTVSLGGDAGVVTAAIGGSQWTATMPLPLDDFVQRGVTVVATDPAGNSTMVGEIVIVDRVPPALSFSFPAQNQALNIASFDGGGAVRATWAASDGDPQLTISFLASTPDAGSADGGVDAGGWVTVSGTERDISTSSVDDGATYQAFLRAVDTAGNESTAQVTFTVDRVAPVPVLTPPDGTRNAAPLIQVTFSEAVQPLAATSPLVVMGWDAGAWTSPTTYTVTGFPPDSVWFGYVDAGVVRDLAGNPNQVGTSAHFHTQVASLPQGSTLIATNVTAFDSASDPDGVLTVAYAQAGGFHLVRVDPKTGVLVDLAPTGLLGPPQSFPVDECYGYRLIQPDLSAQRLSGFSATYCLSTGVCAVRRGTAYVIGSGAVTATADFWLVPVPNGFAEPIAEVGFINPGPIYVRGDAGTPLSASVSRVDYFDPFDYFNLGQVNQETTYWTAIELDGGAIQEEDLNCQVFLGQPACQLGAPRVVDAMIGPSSRLSIATMISSNRMDCIVYDGVDGGRISQFSVKDSFCRPGMPCTCLAEESSPAAQSLRVAAGVPPALLGAHYQGASTTIELDSRDLGVCSNPWNIISMVPGSAGAVDFRAARLGNGPGVLFLDSSGNLFAYSP